MRAPGRGDLVLLQGLQEGGLSLGRRAVDLVGEQEVGEHRPAHEFKGAAAGLRVLLEYLGARDVGGHEVRGELDALELQVQDAREAREQERLGQARDPDEEAMPGGEEGDEQLLDDALLAHDDAPKLVEDALLGREQLLGELHVACLRHVDTLQN